LEYLKRTDFDRYRHVVQTLNIPVQRVDTREAQAAKRASAAEAAAAKAAGSKKAKRKLAAAAASSTSKSENPDAGTVQ